MVRVYLDVESYPDADPARARVIAVGLLVDWTSFTLSSTRIGLGGSVRFLAFTEWDGGGEAGVIRRVYGYLEGLASGGASFVEVVGFNILGFDVPILVRRAVELGVAEAAGAWGLWKRLLPRDLFQAFLPLNCMTRRGLSLSRLAEAARRVGLEVPPLRGSGADVPRLYEAGAYREIVEHLKADLLAARALDLQFGELYRRLGPCGLKDLEAAAAGGRG